MRIWKFPLHFGENVFSWPPSRGARPLSVQMQRGEVVLFALIADEPGGFERRFVLVATGSAMDPAATYIGTVLDGNTGSGYHVFERAL